jgi:atypical dual specificity phosphatase
MINFCRENVFYATAAVSSALGLYAARDRIRQLWKYTLYNVSLKYTILSQTERWNKIGDLNLYLGAIPLETLDDHNEIKKSGVNVIITLLEKFEQEPSLLYTPVSGKLWEDNNIKQYVIEAEDFNPLSIDQIKEGIKYIHDELQKNNTIYVHCKAGRGRSALLVIAYHMVTKNMSLDDAMMHVKKHRPTINMNRSQLARLKQFEKDLNKNFTIEMN